MFAETCSGPSSERRIFAIRCVPDFGTVAQKRGNDAEGMIGVRLETENLLDGRLKFPGKNIHAKGQDLLIESQLKRIRPLLLVIREKLNAA